jgi:SAM-dependent methyltransferase
MTLKTNSRKIRNKLLQVVLEKTALIPKQTTQFKISNLSRIGSSVNSVYTFSIQYTYQNDVVLQLVLKLFEPNEAQRDLCRKGYQVLKFLKVSGFFVPEVYAMELDDTCLGGPFMILEKVQGESMRDYVIRHKENEVHEILSRFAESCVELSRINVYKIGENVLDIPEDEYSYARSSAALVDNLNRGSDWNYEWVVDWLKINAEKCPCTQYSLLHIDMNLKNFIVTEEKEIVFLDWEWVDVGDPLRDVTCAYHELEHVIGREHAIFFLNQYVSKSKIDIDSLRLRFYLVISAMTLVLYFRFLGTRSTDSRKSILKIFGAKSFLVLPIIQGHFLRRSKRLETYVRGEVLNYEKLMYNTVGGLILSRIELDGIMELTNTGRSDIVLDIGTGSGRVAREIISKTNARVIGIDLGFQLMGQSEQKSKFLDNYERIMADGQHLPFKNNSFDVVVCIRAFKYLPNYVLGLSEMKRALKQSGLLIFDLSSVFGYEIVLRRVTHSLGARGHHVFNIFKMKSLLTRTGFCIVKSIPLQKVPHPLWNLSKNLTILRLIIATEEVLKTVTPPFLSRSILLKCVRL